jgi:hypothetical protein
LGFVFRGQLFAGLQFENDGVFNQEIGIVLADVLAFVLHVDLGLGKKAYPPFGQFNRKGVLVDLLQKAPAEPVANVIKRAIILSVNASCLMV